MTKRIDLRRHCLAGGPQIVALGAERHVNRDQLRDRVLELSRALAARPEHRWGIWHHSAWDFLCSFMALALAGKQIVMPHNMQTGTAQVLAKHYQMLLTDAPLTAELHSSEGQLTPEQLLADGTAPVSDLPVPTEPVDLILFTSGSTGEPQPIRKTLELLELELATLERNFGPRLGQTSVLSTVSHQHIYGLLHHLLWPWWRGAPFVIAPCQFPEELAVALRRWQPATLVSSPTHLSRLPRASAFRNRPEGVQEVISSGGLLAEQDALAMAELTGSAPLEILGSTETGSVAWRRRTGGERWQPLQGVMVERSANDCLLVKSPHVGRAEGFEMGDRVQLLDDGGFILLGRADRIVKVEGKRLSLTEMQRHLEAHGAIAEARIILVKGRREQLAVVATLTEAGQAQLASGGKLALNQALRAELRNYFETPVLPRRWRYVDELPYNAQGKVTEAALQEILNGDGP